MSSSVDGSPNSSSDEEEEEQEVAERRVFENLEGMLQNLNINGPEITPVEIENDLVFVSRTPEETYVMLNSSYDMNFRRVMRERNVTDFGEPELDESESEESEDEEPEQEPQQPRTTSVPPLGTAMIATGIETTFAPVVRHIPDPERFGNYITVVFIPETEDELRQLTDLTHQQ